MTEGPQLFSRTRAISGSMWTRSVFWTALAIAFLALAIFAWRERKRVREKEHPLGGLPHTHIARPVVEPLMHILSVESIGFILAAAAAVYEALA